MPASIVEDVDRFLRILMGVAELTDKPLVCFTVVAALTECTLKLPSHVRDRPLNSDLLPRRRKEIRETSL